MQKTNTNIEMLRVQALSILCTPYPFLDFHGVSPIQEKLDPQSSIKHDIWSDAVFDFDGVSFNQDNLDPHCNTKEQINNEASLDFEGFTPVQDKSNLCCSIKEQIQNNDEENIEEREFSFPCADVQGMRIFADDIFENGQIRKLIPHLHQSLLLTSTSKSFASPVRPCLKKIFIINSVCPQSRSDVISKEPQNELLENITFVEMKDSTESYKKSNSTGSSNLWRCRQNMNLRCNSDHKDSLVLLNPSAPKNHVKTKVESIVVEKRKEDHPKNALSTYEKLYLTNKTRKGSNKRRSFLPYKHQLLGFFTNMNGLSKNLHPF
ncbi:uncharacterized protein LOC131619006 [Vicia villosa]|uniref:uncharacterized protein LOC131619006 n=1 Tax=Vicia villosa TaxID=3911 RepID=UPI00273ACE55|nr:uncharacterized protein LOC131619006 [Vicia villosa]